MNTPDPKPRKGLALGSAAVGAAAILGSLLAFSGGAGAQDAPELSEPAAAEVVEDTNALVGDAEIIELGDDMIELDLELDGAFAEYDEAFAAYDECIENELGIDFESADEAAWEAITDDAWTAADAACEDQLPQEIRDMNAAWENYDNCLAENGLDFSDEVLAFDEVGDEALAAEFGAAVFVEDGDNFTMAEFGEADGIITITQTDGEIVVATEGDVELLDEDVFDIEIDEEWEAAHAACEGELPEDAFFGEALLDEDDLALFDLTDDAVEVPADA